MDVYNAAKEGKERLLDILFGDNLVNISVSF